MRQTNRKTKFGDLKTSLGPFLTAAELTQFPMLNKKNILRFLGSATITGLLLYAILSDKGLSELTTIFSKIDSRLLIVFIIVSITGLIARAYRYHLVFQQLLDSGKQNSFKKMLIVTAIRNGLVDLLPARLGEASFLYICNRFGIPLLSAASAFGVCFALDIIILFGLFSALLFETILAPNTTQGLIKSPELAAAAGIVATVILGFALWKLDFILQLVGRVIVSLKNQSPSKLRLKKLTALFEFAEEAVVHISKELSILKEKRAFLPLVIVTIVLRTAKYASLYLLLIAVVAPLGVDTGAISPVLSSTAFIAAEASASLPITGLMGFGTYEAAWVLIFSLSQVKITSISSVILAVHIITQVVGYSLAVIGLLAFLFLELRSRS